MMLAKADHDLPRQMPLVPFYASIAVGIVLCGWVNCADLGLTPGAWLALAVVVPLAPAVPAVRRRLATVVSHPIAGADGPPSFRTSAIVAVVAAVYLAGSAVWQGRDLGPHAHDEFAYLLQARQLASGRLWSTVPADIADAFDSPYLIVRPVYASLTWPGTALAYAPGVKLGWPPWVTAAALAGLVVGAFFHLVREVGGATAVAGLAALFLVVVRPFHTISVTANSHVTVLLGGLIAAVAAVRWARTVDLRWAFVGGAAAGWAAICRPIDAICLILPIAVAACLGRPGRGRSALVRAVLCAGVAAGPFIAVQLVFDRGVTGRWLQTPFTFYCHRDYPQVTYGFPAYDPAARPASVVPQKRDLYQQFAVPFVIDHQPDRWWHDWLSTRLPGAFRGGQPSPLLVLVVPLGALALARDRRRFAIATLATVPLFAVGYAPYTIFLPTYAVLCAPALCLSAAVGVATAAGRWRSAAVRTGIVVAAVVLAIAMLPESHSASDDPARPAGAMVARALDQMIPPPARALVLFRYHPGNPVHDEPVYNWTVPEPDAARIVLAHDLGPLNGPLIRHYADVQPDRRVYRLDRADYRLTDLGTVGNLARPD